MSAPARIFGGHIAALGVLRTLRRRGVRAYVVDETSDIIVGSRWYRPAERKLRETADSAVLADYLASLRLAGAVLVPCSDNWALAVAGLPEPIRTRFPSCMAARDTVETFVDKQRFGALVEELAIPHPRTHRLAHPGDLDGLSDAQLADAFLKPTDPQLHRRAFGTKGSFARSRADAVRLLEAGRKAGVKFVLQEWIPGEMSATLLIEGFVDSSGEVVGMVARRRLRVAPPMIGNTVSSVSIPLEEVAPALPHLRRLLKATGYRGAFNVEFKLDVRDGQLKIIELNPRPAWYVATIARAGLDIPWAFYRDALGLPVERPTAYHAGRYQLYEFRDALAVARYLRRFRRPEGAVLGPWLWGDHTVFWWSDPLPTFIGAWQIVDRRLQAGRGGRGRGGGAASRPLT